MAVIILSRLRTSGPIFFTELFSEDHSVAEYVVSFLALLELAHQGLVRITQAALGSDIQLTPCFGDDDETRDGQPST